MDAVIVFNLETGEYMPAESCVLIRVHENVVAQNHSEEFLGDKAQQGEDVLEQPLPDDVRETHWFVRAEDCGDVKA
jgi:hypothetical protein